LSSMRRSSVSRWRRQFEFPVPIPACSTESRELPSGTPSNSAISSPSNYVLLLTTSAAAPSFSCLSGQTRSGSNSWPWRTDRFPGR
jgi:hypothetical protein